RGGGREAGAALRRPPQAPWAVARDQETARAPRLRVRRAPPPLRGLALGRLPMLDFLRRYFNLDHIPERQAEAQAMFPPAEPPPYVDDDYILEALARGRGYPSAQALAAAEPHLVSSFKPPAPNDWDRAHPPLTPEEFEAQMRSLESWLGPLDNVSRLIGAIATGQNPLRVWDDRLPPEERPPTISEVLVDRGVPPW